MADRRDHLTPNQRRAIDITDRSVLVSAAAGSGKTTVLAERCAALLCDPPREQRCNIEDLLVVTFTDAAAGEMRSRIRTALQKRLQESPRDGHVERQLYMLEAASISTIHSFCRGLILRWFPQAGVDPHATVLGEDEAMLLRHEVLDALFLDLYGGDNELSGPFQSLVDDYGGGQDARIARIVLDLYAYVSSLPDPQGWLSLCIERLNPAAPHSLLADLHEKQHDRLGEELRLQIEFCRYAADVIRRCWPVAEMHAAGVEEHARRLQEWHDALARASVETWETVAASIRDFQFGRAASRPRKLSDDEKAAYDAAKGLRDRMKDLFRGRLSDRICRFTAEEYRQGLERIEPYVRTLTRLVSAFEQRYQDAKDAHAAVDFNDLQRCAMRLLSEDGDPCRPSAVARRLQQTYQHVLVDEFQDIDPLQEAILRLVSRESADPPQGNLFAVGDIKQSIYRFRLAEPKLFAQRAAAFKSDSRIGQLIPLPENFRSRSQVVAAVNAVFRPLLRAAFGGSDYGPDDELKAAAAFPASADGPLFGTPAVELHLLEPITHATRQHDDDDDDEEEDEGTAPAPEDELEGIQREAFLIGQRIQGWMGQLPPSRRWSVGDRPKTPGGPPTARPIEYRDIVILLRSLPHKAQPIADVLRRMGIPVLVGRDDSRIDTTEFHDVVSLLRLLDNRQQDIPLAAVLRSPLLGAPISETDLVKLRTVDRHVPFHEAVARYAEHGPDKALRGRIAAVLAMIDRYRTRIRQAPVAEVLWEMLDEHSYLGYVAGLPGGIRRRDHLIRLHELARQFGQFSRQGLRRFLRFIDEMVDRERAWQQPPSAGADDNLVRIMTVHASKGLEFPVVVLADLGKPFNLDDLRGPVLLDRDLGIAMQAADPDRRIFYPTFAYQLAEAHNRVETLSEELRLLYVALTRAREHLVLVGRVKLDVITMYRQVPGSTGGTAALPRLQLETASNPLDWLLPALSVAAPRVVQWDGARHAEGDALFSVHAHRRVDTDQWRIPPAVDENRTAELGSLARLEPLPAGEPVIDAPEVRQIIGALRAEYPALDLTTLPARVAVTELKRRWDATTDPQERSQRPRRRAAKPPRPVFISPDADDHATARGMATHRFLQHVDLSRPCDLADLQDQCRLLVAACRLAPAEAAAVMLEAAAWFFGTDLGRQMRHASARVRREVTFIWRLPPEQYSPHVKARDDRDVLLVRGMVDVVVRDETGLTVIDYKTDAVAPEDCETLAERYCPQIGTYAAAVQAIYRQPVTRAWLVFLHPRRIIEGLE